MPSPLQLAQEHLQAGRTDEAILALEGEVSQNPESSEGWRLLGQLHAENDQDVEAIYCLKKGHEVDPYNLDSLLALGVSCTNELDAPQALSHLKTWLANHEEFQSLDGVTAPTPPLSDFLAVKQQVASLFTRAAAMSSVVNSPALTDVHVALGVVHTIDRNFEAAIHHFAEALKARPKDYSLWNKLGATLANSGHSEASLAAYHQALALKPNYTRGWSNLAIAHANLDHYEDAIRFYLTALSLNGKAKHIWHYIHTALLHQGRYDLLTAVEQQSVPALATHFPGVVSRDALPPPSSEPPEDSKLVLSRIYASLAHG